MLQFWIISVIVIVRFLLVHGEESTVYDFKPEVKQGNYSTDIPIVVDASKEIIILFPESYSKNPYVVSTWSNNNVSNHPIFVMARQQDEEISWELPLSVRFQTKQTLFYNVSRTLCPSNIDNVSLTTNNITYGSSQNEVKNSKFPRSIIVSISTASTTSISLMLRVSEENNFYLEGNKSYNGSVSPSQPKFFYFNYGDKNNVILQVVSESGACLIVSIQNASCPVFYLDENVEHQGKYQTVSSQGAITIKQTEYSNGFFVVFVHKADNFDCSEKASMIPLQKMQTIKTFNDSSVVMFSINPSPSYELYLKVSWWTAGVLLVFYLIFIGIYWGIYRFQRELYDIVINSDEDDPLITVNGDEVTENLHEKETLLLSDLAKQHPEHYKNCFSYFWQVVNVSLFYGIPVVQLVIACQRALNSMGNEDICYYNFLCSHPLFGYNDFNHIFSNVGYIIAGISFLAITLCKDKILSNDVHNRGIPKQFDLFYAMGVALIMEGILSACYHICPNKSNFQFDSSFMYVMVTLYIIKLYQNRHPDINPTAYASFVMLGLVLFSALMGVVSGHIVYWIFFIIVYIVQCLFTSFRIYYLNKPREGLRKLLDVRRNEGIWKAMEPIKKERFKLLVVANIINILMASTGIWCYFYHVDFGRFLLLLLIGNALLYTTIYIVMKIFIGNIFNFQIINGEKLYVQTVSYGVLAMALGATALYFFINKSIDWQLTPAESKQLNRKCTFLDFYDYHDMWHLLSAPALFFSFMLLLSLDDDLVNVLHSNIPVF